jgi:hypothetical protein
MKKAIIKYLKENNIKNYDLKYNWIRKIFELTIENNDRVLRLYDIKDINRIKELLEYVK